MSPSPSNFSPGTPNSLIAMPGRRLEIGVDAARITGEAHPGLEGVLAEYPDFQGVVQARRNLQARVDHAVASEDRSSRRVLAAGDCAGLGNVHKHLLDVADGVGASPTTPRIGAVRRTCRHGVSSPETATACAIYRQPRPWQSCSRANTKSTPTSMYELSDMMPYGPRARCSCAEQPSSLASTRRHGGGVGQRREIWLAG